MSYVALYRKFRPSVFDDVRGQDAVVTTLRNQLKAGRIGHAYLFCGTRGTGKTTVAKILARAVNCEDPREDGSPCNCCAMCRSILSGTSTDVQEIDAASNNGVDNIREIREEVVYRPAQGKYKVYIIDEAHMLSPGAWNALLKTLEEPPEYVIFMLATTEVHKIPATIMSRCQQYNFRRITADVISKRLRELCDEEDVRAGDDAIRYIAKAADGSMRDALSILDQCIAFYLGEELTYKRVLDVLGTVDAEVFSRLFAEIRSGNVAGCMAIFHDMINDGRDVGQFVADLTGHFRDLLLTVSSDGNAAAAGITEEEAKRLAEEAGGVPAETLIRYIHVLSGLAGQLRTSSQRQVLTETALIRLCRPQTETDLEGILDRVRTIEEKLEKGIVPAAAAHVSGAVGTGDGVAGAGTGEAAGKHAGREEEPPVKKEAAPDDLKLIAAQWRRIVSRTGYVLKPSLEKAGQPKYDTSTGQPVLYIEAGDKVSRDTLKKPEHLEELRKVIAEVTGKELDYTIKVTQPGEGSSLEAIPLEEVVAREVKVPVEGI